MNQTARISKRLAASMIGAAMLVVSSMASALPAGLIPAPPKVAAKSYILLDADSGEILAESNSDEAMPPASLTKMMTAYVVENELASGNISRNDLVTVSEKAWRMRGSLMFIEVGEKVTVSDLLKGVIIVSGNDASVALAEYVAGSEDAFSQVMNATAQQLGMENSHFKNASGWPTKGHYASARDLAKLSRAIIYDHPEYYDIYNEREFQYGVNKSTGKPLNPQPNRNTLLWTNPDVDGLKTGHTDAAGYCLAASAKKDDRRLIAVVMGTASERARANETQKLLTYGFRFFENVEVNRGGVALEQVRVWKGDRDQLSVGLEKDLVVTVPRGRGKDVNATMSVESDLEAPIQAGQVVGSVIVKIDDEIVEEKPLIALEDVQEGGFFKRLWDGIVRFFMGLFS
ncbi:D-alanyl-D-alanine carboxypeptidase [Sansalvadorimonas sp. 2012CJ34-2]|uniref:serine-type D-Ala-D-Ala carboxypeptidase n=1 Tax=Parendozoicomonas callyspongiae TaxID=2942213 RepID=A0ABT0PF20_9GAMM|nr:D-alanyl-D-alanine carboxypeptidase family protein [Sansalvadorimonas sp. 2012CJ34-2]MCL6269128.1 D-alanyl-D-alanine carboxypeptidase [Sansalvadorimonas sp. 2012CJ34-2]